MKWKRKTRRKGLHKTSCCGRQMTYKAGYGYFCERCGKTKNEEVPEEKDVVIAWNRRAGE